MPVTVYKKCGSFWTIIIFATFTVLQHVKKIDSAKEDEMEMIDRKLLRLTKSSTFASFNIAPVGF